MLFFLLLACKGISAAGAGSFGSPMPSFHPQQKQYQEPTISSLTGETRPSVLTINSIDATKGHNTSFTKDVSWNLKTFLKFVNEDPRAKEQLNALLHNYGIISPDTIGDANGLALPNPEYMLKEVEEALAINASFKEFLRKLLENVQQYLSRSSMILAECVIGLKAKYSQIAGTVRNYQETKSALLKNQLFKGLLDLKQETEKLIQKFHDVAAWRSVIVNGVSTNL